MLLRVPGQIEAGPGYSRGSQLLQTTIFSYMLDAGMSAPGGSVDEPLLQRQDNALSPTQSGSPDSGMAGDMAGDLEPFFIPDIQAPLQHGMTVSPASLWCVCGLSVRSTDAVYLFLASYGLYIHTKNRAHSVDHVPYVEDASGSVIWDWSIRFTDVPPDKLCGCYVPYRQVAGQRGHLSMMLGAGWAPDGGHSGQGGSLHKRTHINSPTHFPSVIGSL